MGDVWREEDLKRLVGRDQDRVRMEQGERGHGNPTGGHL